MMKYYDTHGHINCEPLVQETTSIITKMREENVIQNCSGYDYESSLKAINLAKKYPDCILATIAVHPNDVQKFDLKKTEKQFQELLCQNKDEIVGIGECGLDCHYSTEYLALQFEWLKMHAKLANDFNLPLILHIRDAHEKIIKFLSENAWIKVPIVIHCFSQGVAILKSYESLSQVVYYSIPGIVTFKKANELQEAVKKIPLNKLLSETDCPWLAPVPNRGKTNYPFYIKYTVQKIAELRNKSWQEISETIYKNSIELFWKSKTKK